MRTFPGALTTTIGTESFRLAGLVKLVRDDGTTFGWTDWDADLSVDIGDGDGTLSYSAAGMESLGVFAARLNAPPDDVELKVATDEAALLRNDVRKGLFRGSVVTVSYVDPNDLGNPALHRRYDVGTVRVEGRVVTLELIGMEKRLEQDIKKNLTSNCPHLFGDTDCGMEIDAAQWQAETSYAKRARRDEKSGDIVRPVDATDSETGFWYMCTEAGVSGAVEPTWPTTLGATVSDGQTDAVTWEAIRPRRMEAVVDSVTNRQIFFADLDPMVDFPADWWGNGLVIWNTGDNAGIKAIVRDSTAPSAGSGVTQITLKLPIFADIQVGDTLTLVAGCRKRRPDDCLDKWDNNFNFGGDEHLIEESATVTAKRGDGGGGKK